jgi:hypothetical protein
MDALIHFCGQDGRKLFFVDDAHYLGEEEVT